MVNKVCLSILTVHYCKKLQLSVTDSLFVEVIIKKTITSTEKKKKKDSKKAFNALSFEDEEGDVEEFQIKKTKASRTMKLQLSE